MIYETLVPAPPLGEAVASIWIYSGYRPPHFLERVLPAGTVEMIVQLADEPFRSYDPRTFALAQTQRGPLVVGPRAEVQIIDTLQQLDVMGVHFRPGGFRALFGLPTDELAGLDVPVDELWRGLGAELTERLAATPTRAGKLRVAEALLARRMTRDRRSHPAVPVALRAIEQADATFRVGDLAAELGLSARRFIEVFTAHVGLAPKAYARVRRFQRALRAIHDGAHASWADAAVDGGWYDQAHMIRDFQAFAGLTPAEYARLKGEFLLHVPVAERGQICPIPPARPPAESPP